MQKKMTIMFYPAIMIAFLFLTGCDDSATTPALSPILSLSETLLDFENELSELTFDITNTGGGTLEWEISENVSWFTVSPDSGATIDQTERITIAVSRTGLPIGNYSGELIVESNVGDRTVSIIMSITEVLIWSYEVGNNDDIDTMWVCFDDDSLSGEDYWGSSTDAREGSYSVSCAGRGDHEANQYDNDMNAWMQMKPENAVDIVDYSDVSVKFWMKYETEDSLDYVRFLPLGTDSTWSFNENLHQWSGSDFTWRQYEAPLSSFQLAPSDSIRFAFFFNSDTANYYQGAFIDDIEVWGRHR
ncbi:BACON domain-containing protein [bacterium]|nr:BACON domain-containing protein [bacterium]